MFHGIRGDRKPHFKIATTFAMIVISLAMLSGPSQAGAPRPGGSLDLNHATAAELETLPGIGAVKAAAILSVRDSKGGFQSMAALAEVRGIGTALVEKLWPLVTIQPQGQGLHQRKTAK
ncbi:MAG: helix-hairpin-helix domain-containing protein [Myxococcota bacterium]